MIHTIAAFLSQLGNVILSFLTALVVLYMNATVSVFSSLIILTLEFILLFKFPKSTDGFPCSRAYLIVN